MPLGASTRPEPASRREWLAGPTVAAILTNPRYTGYAFFGRWSKVEELVPAIPR